jgi:hypothetical protein
MWKFTDKIFYLTLISAFQFLQYVKLLIQLPKSNGDFKALRNVHTSYRLPLTFNQQL